MSIIKRIGVAPMRLQTPDLHAGHINLIETMLGENDIVILVLGVAPVKLSGRNTLNFETRELMVRDYFREFPNLHVVPLNDVPHSDEVWSDNLDNLIVDFMSEETNLVTLYGSRDSFIPYYHGKFNVKEIAEVDGNLSGTTLRVEAQKNILPTRDFRHGVFYGANDRFDISYTTVDAFIMSDDGYVLIGRKPNRLEYCLIGGFVEPSNPSFEEAIIREVKEETCLDITTTPEYLFSARVNDVRYKNERDKIITAVFKVTYNGDKSLAKGADDIAEVRWVKLKDLRHNMFIDAHQDFVNRILNKLWKSNY
jgi:bifunctional NMN adenylyltransferase/nudix hydrolase